MLLQTTPLRVSQLSFLRTSLLSFFLFLFCHLTYGGKKEAELDPPPPFPQSIQAKVYLGETVDIALEAIGRDAKEAIFLLRTKPKFGKLQNLRSIEPGKALITYTHQKPAPSGTDEFLYAVKSPKSPVSAPAKVTIHIVQRPPEPVIPNSLDLGVVYVGSNLTAFLRIENHGGSPFVTTPSADPPFLLPTTQQIRIPPKSFYDLQVFYEPKTEEEFLGSIRFSHDPSAQTLVKANAKLPFRVTPRELTIPQPNGKAKLLIENRTPSSLSFEVEVPPVLRSTSTLLIPPYSDKFLEIEAACSSGAESTGNITLTALNHSLRIPFHLLPSPPIIHVLPSQNLNFGQVFPQNSTTLTFSLRNSGGAPAQISIQTPSWLPVHGPSDLLLQPQETKEIHLSFDPTHVGLHEGKIHIHGSEEPLTIHV
ncbi:MAG: hypothetical protein NZL93_00275, partial [Chthoniobacterales bacterium]|nr:hypothetical protein [Chthoniobacterales bacterium]